MGSNPIGEGMGLSISLDKTIGDRENCDKRGLEPSKIGLSETTGFCMGKDEISKDAEEKSKKKKRDPRRKGKK